jgi:Sec-independent protein translocase protein TatA
MSISEKEPAGPHDPLHYAPRRLRERPEPRLASTSATLALLDNKRPDAAVGRITTPVPVDPQLESAVYESLRRPLDPTLLGETRALEHEFEGRGALFGVVGRVVAAVGISAIIALFFVIMMPASRQPDAAPTFSETVQSFTNALGQQPAQAQSEEARKPALAEFQSLLTPGTAQAAERQQPDKEAAEKTLQQLLQWRQKTGETSP